jgi:hypothetical protein
VAATDPIAVAARNNALWCDAVCRAHDRPGVFDEVLWRVPLGAPPLYPDVVTLAGPIAADAQHQAIGALLAGGRHRDWAIKDSYAALDLSSLGFRPLFDASWITWPDAQAIASTGLQWRVIADSSGLIEWNEAWGKNAPFTPLLLASPDIAFVAATHDGAQVGGAILNRGAGVVGASNVFAQAPWHELVWRDLPALAARLFAGHRLVGYESGASLERACAAGFVPFGGLRVWQRLAPGS